MNFRPINDYILLELDPLREVTKGGIILPDDRPGERVRTGTVMRVGPGRWVGSHRRPIRLEKGEKVAFLRWNLEHQTGKTITGFLANIGENLGLIREDDVLFALMPGEKVEIE
jgi:co-chaperonin GroES (HSP10)